MRIKAQSDVISFTLTVLFGVIILVSITALVLAIYDAQLKTNIKTSLGQITVQVRDNVLKLYENAKKSESSPSNYTSILLGEIDMQLPPDVAKKNYEVALVGANPLFGTLQNLTIDNQTLVFVVTTPGAKIIAMTAQDPIILVETDIQNLDVGVQGSVLNGQNAVLKYYRYNVNGTVKDKITLGNPDILVDITKIS